MKKKDIFKVVNDPKMIPGIYNYCDRWCERCEFIQRCANFAISENQFSDKEDLDISNKHFWEKLSEIFQVTMEMVMETAKEHGIDLDKIDYETIEKAEKQIDEKVANLECSLMSKDYIGLVKNWFESSEDIFNEKLEELQKIEELGLPDSTPVREADDLNDIVEVIHWYQYQIHVKIMRASRGKLEDNYETEDEYPKDSDGSAKVALIGIDRSIAAWGKMLSYLPDHEDELLKILVHLERLRRITEAEFPDARAFVRAGFDEK
jgi:hypothetical protein